MTTQIWVWTILSPEREIVIWEATSGKEESNEIPKFVEGAVFLSVSLGMPGVNYRGRNDYLQQPFSRRNSRSTVNCPFWLIET